MKINIGTQEEEAEEEPTEHLQRRQKTSTAKQTGERSNPKKDGMLLSRTEDPIPMVEPEPVRTEPVTELPAQQAISAGQDMTRPVIQEPVIQLPPSPVHQEQAAPE